MLSFRIEFGVCFFAALGLLILPLDWFLGAVLAASIHEFCHYCVAWIQNVKCLSVQIGVSGAVMEFGPMTRTEELLTAAAGPAGSFALCGLACIYPQLAVCGVVQGLFNLLPVWPLDGGRIVRCMLGGRVKYCRRIEYATAVIILILGLLFEEKLGWGPAFFAGIVTLRAFLRKIPCKDALLGVQ